MIGYTEFSRLPALTKLYKQNRQQMSYMHVVQFVFVGISSGNNEEQGWRGRMGVKILEEQSSFK